MRVVILHESPAADEVAGSFARAAQEFNRGLDIRLRFLDVGFSLREVPVRDEDDFAAVTLSETTGAFRPGAVLALGTGPKLLECVGAAVKARLPVVYLMPETEERATAAIARIATVVVTPRAEDAPAGIETATLDGRPVGPALVDIIVRSVREDHAP